MADLEPIDRLEEKIKLLVGVVGKLRAEQAKATEDNGRLVQENATLAQEVERLQAQLDEAEGTNAEVSVLRDERDVIRTRVAEMLQQLEAI
jgi:regulator of replication initiation timing